MLADRAFSKAVRSLGLVSVSPQARRAATVISVAILVKILPL
jgi:hypothetical protein